MQAYTSGDYVYFNNMKYNPKKHHFGFIFNQRHEMYIISPWKIMEETFLSLPNLFVKKDQKWMNSNIQIVAQLSKVTV